MSTIIESIERRQLRRVPRFDPGDRVRVHFQVIEGTRRRTQVFEGIVIGRQGSGARETFTVRKQSFGVGVERTFPLHSPKIDQLEVVARGDVRRAKLYYLRGRVGKRARVTERAWSGEVEEAIMPEADDRGDRGRARRDRVRGAARGGGPRRVRGARGRADQRGSGRRPGRFRGRAGGDRGGAEAAEAAEAEPEAAGDEDVESGDEGEAGEDGAESAEPESDSEDSPEPDAESDSDQA